jgi:hypothetical protein
LLLALSVRYFGDTTPAGRDVQNAVNGVVKEQKQPLAQGRVALQVPPQVVEPWESFRNCRAETVPAERTAVIMAIRNVFLMILFVINTPPIRLKCRAVAGC